MSSEKKSECLLLRLTPSDKQKASHNANLLGISMNEYIVRCIRLKRIVICENLPELIYHLGKIGTNINQIAAVANTNEYVSVNNVEEVKKLMKDCYGAKGWKVSKPGLPVHFISGAEDPCRISDKALGKALDALKAVGYKDVTLKIYPGMRHEIHNETGCREVWDDILAYLA